MTRDRRPSLSRRTFLALAGASAIAGCQTESDTSNTPTPPPVVEGGYEHPTPRPDPDWEAPTTAPRTDIQVETLVENLEIPWDISFSGAGELYMTERTGRILRFDSGEVSEVARPADAIDAGSLPPGSDKEPWWVTGGEGGTLGVAVHPEFPDKEWVYVYYTAGEDDNKENRVARFDVGASDPASTEEILIEGIPASKIHNGGRIRFGPDENLWVCCGDAGEGAVAQDLSSLAGKILRITPEGKAPASNPKLGGDRRIFTYGHRNPQGLDWLPSGVPVASEHGPANRDEVNVLLPGRNYGWNEVRGVADDPSDAFDTYPERSDVMPPVVNTGPHAGWAPTGATFYTGDSLPSLRNRFVVGGLVSQSLWSVTLTPSGEELPPLNGGTRYDSDWTHDAYTATAHRLLEDELGRIRHVAQSPTGDLYAITSNRDGRASGQFPRQKDDVLVRLTPP
ncbi:PQQ-dependent sugar dehydrogenase [Salinibaculum rarum]|uniref:PQQ-dependent sugar dehydrogenase n=1 Tax=Salinibaculum rarum TaxID=3058903 RepID=UPI00265F69D2|nr:PQQ-dependent sugar dehydrogenase [Salinibaculum sp. KK48]